MLLCILHHEYLNKTSNFCVFHLYIIKIWISNMDWICLVLLLHKIILTVLIQTNKQQNVHLLWYYLLSFFILINSRLVYNINILWCVYVNLGVQYWCNINSHDVRASVFFNHSSKNNKWYNNENNNNKKNDKVTIYVKYVT